MKFSYSWICEYLEGKKPSVKEMADVLMFHSFEVEGVEKVGSDFVLDIKVLPNRICDCSGHIGIAREVAAVMKLKLKDKISKIQIKNKKLKHEKENKISVRIENPKDCLRYTGLVIRGIKVGESPQWIKDRLVACGLKPINNIVDATNYEMLETGQPLHAFDVDKINDGIIVRRAKRGESIKTLDKEKTSFELDENVLVIADSKNPIAIAGIKGGMDTGIDENTKNIIVEAANFYGPLIRKASQKLKLKTDASMRFENWISPSLIDEAQNRAGELIKQLAGGIVASNIIDVYPKKLLQKNVKLDLGYVNKVLGENIKKADVIKILNSLGFKNKAVGNNLLVSVPLSRLDINLREDLIEEIGRLYGYEKIKSEMPFSKIVLPNEDEELVLENKLKDYFTSVSFNEVLNYSFISKQDKDLFSFGDDVLVELENPLSSLTQYLRPMIGINLLKTAKENLKFFENVKLFEIGKIFKKDSLGKVLETKSLGGIIAGEEKENFLVLKGIVSEVISEVSKEKLFWDKLPKEHQNIYNPANSLCIKIGKDKEIIGILGEVHPAILENIGIKSNCCIFWINMDKLIEFASFAKQYEPIGQYPAVERDISLWIPNNFEVAEVLEFIEAEVEKNKKENETINISLVSVDEKIASSVGKNNIIIRISYKAKNKGLSSEDINPKQEKVISAIEARDSWEVRR